MIKFELIHHSNGSKCWYLNGKLHREDGPAVEWPNGSKFWYLFEKLHREDGPAIETPGYHKKWFLNDRYLGDREPENWNELVKSFKSSKSSIDNYGGTKEWWVDGKRHREDGPAVIEANGTMSWYVNNQLHREDGPAIEYYDGSKCWYMNGKLHREDGPAVKQPKQQYWYLDGKFFGCQRPKNWNKLVKIYQIKFIMEI